MFITNERILRTKQAINRKLNKQLKDTLAAQEAVKNKAETNAKAEYLTEQLKNIPTTVHE